MTFDPGIKEAETEFEASLNTHIYISGQPGLYNESLPPKQSDKQINNKHTPWPEAQSRMKGRVRLEVGTAVTMWERILCRDPGPVSRSYGKMSVKPREPEMQRLTWKYRLEGQPSGLTQKPHCGQVCCFKHRKASR